ncbi:preprotein translocase subunit TatC [Streptacidiphilus sp. 4-A2]|nr:preprotein translocase subunit TatC [Streptacidiphilus sp. 4-A2]
MSDTQTSAGRTVGRQKTPKNDEGRMPLADHLRELRNRLAISILALLVGTVLGFLVHDWALHQMTGPICNIPSLHGVAAKTPGCPNGVRGRAARRPVAELRRVDDAGAIISSPVWSYQLWPSWPPGCTRRSASTAWASSAPRCRCSSAARPLPTGCSPRPSVSC